MCGINGFYNYSNVNIPDPKQLISGMNLKIQHRGPDDTGVWINNENHIYFGHQRLSIIDLSTKGHQPMKSTTGNVIIFNGEIYNYRELKKEFVDYKFDSNSDTEVLLKLYDHYGQDCINFLNGMFAFGIWDNGKSELFLARDRIGIKPLYYTTQNGIFVFSSEIKSILSLPWVKTEVNETELYHFLTYNKTTPPNTLFKGIFKFHPGYKMLVNKHGIQSYEPYWEIDYSICEQMDEKDYINQISIELNKSVSYRMVSDVPVGAFLSGGVDSSGVVAYMRENTDAPIHTFSIGFKDSPDYDELQYAREISNIFKTNHKEIIVSPSDIREFLPEIVNIFDDPLADATSIPIYFISKLAKENGIKVILTGDGPDELFCGYNRWLKYYNNEIYFNSYKSLPKFIKSGLSRISNYINSNSHINDLLYRGTENYEYFWGGAGGIKESVKGEILSVEFSEKMKKINSHNILEHLKENKLKNNNYNDIKLIDWMCYIGLAHIIPNYYLYRADRLGMANSIELRVPFLDHNFVNLAMSIPGKLKIKNGEPKYILKKALEQQLPKQTLYRKKMGFCVPLNEWSGEIMNNYIKNNLGMFCKNTGYFNPIGLNKQILRNNTFGKWNLYYLMNWFNKWIF